MLLLDGDNMALEITQVVTEKPGLIIMLILIAIIFAVVHVLTGFDPLNERQSDLALFGIRLQAAIIPAAIVLFGLFVFLKYYNLTPEKTAINKQKLKELGL